MFMVPTIQRRLSNLDDFARIVPAVYKAGIGLYSPPPKKAPPPDVFDRLCRGLAFRPSSVVGA